jgi:hypothetical protein
MSNRLFEANSLTNSARAKKNMQSFNFNNSGVNQNKSKRRLESAKTNFTINTNNNIIMQNKNILNQSNSTENSVFGNYQTANSKREFYNKPMWKFSYYLDKNNLNNINSNNPEIKNVLCDYKDIDKRPKPIVNSWTKPRMIKIIENNSTIEEEVKNNFWKYSHIFENNPIKPPGKLLKILMSQLSQGYSGYGGYGGGSNFLNFNYDNNGAVGGDDINYNKYYNRQWKISGHYKGNKNNYEPIKIKRPNSSYK